MRIVDRYLLRQVFWGYIALFLSFVFLYLIIDIFTHLQDILRDKVSLETLTKYYFFFLPQIFLRVSSLSFLISALYCIGNLNKNNEIISLRIQGLSIWNIAMIFIIFSLVLSMLGLFVEDRLIPVSSTYLQQIEGYKDETASDKQISNFSFHTAEGSVIFAKDFNTEKNLLSNVNIFFQDNIGNIAEEIVAEKLSYENEQWVAYNAFTYTLNENKITTQTPKFNDKKVLAFSEKPQEFVRRHRLNWQDLSLKEMRSHIAKFQSWKTKKIVSFLEVEFHRKIALNFSALFLLLGALPFALKIGTRRVGLSSLGLAILISFLYYLIFSLSSALGKMEFFIPLIACWLPNIFFGVSGIIGLMSLR